MASGYIFGISDDADTAESFSASDVFDYAGSMFSYVNEECHPDAVTDLINKLSACGAEVGQGIKGGPTWRFAFTEEVLRDTRKSEIARILLQHLSDLGADTGTNDMEATRWHFSLTEEIRKDALKNELAEFAIRKLADLGAECDADNFCCWFYNGQGFSSKDAAVEAAQHAGGSEADVVEVLPYTKMWYFSINEDVKRNWFKSKFEDFKKRVSDLTLDQFSTEDPYEIRWLLNDTYNDAVFGDLGFQTMDAFIRKAPCDTYYVSHAYLMH